MPTFFYGILLMALLLSPALAAIDAYEFANPEQEQRFRRLVEELRCPTCQNQNIADSNAPLSTDLRQRIYEMLQQGHSDADIVAFMTARYGDFITYRPPLKPLTWPLWFGPLLLLIAVGLGLAWWIRRRASQPPAELSEQERARLQTLLADSREESKS